jgi:hypothetical protein
MFVKTPPVADVRFALGVLVRLRHNPQVTGIVVGEALDLDRLRVRWDDTDEITDCITAKLEPAQ